MNIKDLSKKISKEQIYRIYEAVTDDYKKYRSITKKECLERIQIAYQDEKILKGFITDHEFELLREVYEKKALPRTFLHQELVNRFILVEDTRNQNHVCINHEIMDVLLPFLEDGVTRDGYDRYDEIIIGLVRYFGVISYEDLLMFLSVYEGEYDEETMLDHISSSSIINYLFLCPEEYVLCCYDLFEDYDKILFNRMNNDFQNILPERNQLITISRYGMDIYQSEIHNTLHLLFNYSYFEQCRLVDFLTHNAHLGEAFYNLKEFLNMNFSFHDLDFKSLEQAYLWLPSASNHGLPLGFKVDESDDDLFSNQEQIDAHLTQSQADLFYKLYLSFLEYINEKYNVCPYIGQIVDVPIDPKDVVCIREVALKHLDELELFAYFSKYHFSEEEKQIICNFKNMKYAHFIIVKYEKDYTLFMDGENLYRVKGAHANISEILEAEKLPILADALLLPFYDEIVVDGVIQSYPIDLGHGFKKIMTDSLKKGKIIKNLTKYN